MERNRSLKLLLSLGDDVTPWVWKDLANPYPCHLLVRDLLTLSHPVLSVKLNFHHALGLWLMNEKMVTKAL